eukprot:CAMPEP_0172813888 /NCGR_PEP_ID=MMETSP1075-20121228/10935_1 /TAXON_ID=2916 /ORGANISM="Ceratium fusus, Strain PA161109" /LENGTH=160 /DNA_ID=CAMNT_0013653641 /DNA_START=11 /DNA_END=489 /DNA_ORIENTATION=-
MEADKYPWMSCSLEGPIEQRGKALTTRGAVKVREASQVVVFKVEVDPKCALGDQLLKVKVTASIDRFKLDICPSWPKAALDGELRLTAVLNFIVDEQNPVNSSREEVHPPETLQDKVPQCPEESHPPETTVEKMAESPEELHPPETTQEEVPQRPEELHP